MPSLPPCLADLGALVVPGIRTVYGMNARRHDPLVGDDGVTFGISVWRNTWFWLEEELAQVDGWKTGRPKGSLAIRGHGYRVHAYKWGEDERVDLETFRLDSAASKTKKGIPEVNRLMLDQLKLDLEPQPAPPPLKEDSVSEWVILHAGNPEDGCCGIWMGAPLSVGQTAGSPWVFIQPLWLIDRAGAVVEGREEGPAQIPHDALPEPRVVVEPLEPQDSAADET